MSEQTPPICLDCRHAIVDHNEPVYCARKAGDFSPVYGATSRVSSAAMQRRAPSPIARWLGADRCGPEGRYFESSITNRGSFISATLPPAPKK